MSEPNKLMTWDEMKKEYPDRWVIIKKTKGNLSTIEEGVVKYVATDDEVSAIWIKCLDEDLGYYRERELLLILGWVLLTVWESIRRQINY